MGYETEESGGVLLPDIVQDAIAKNGDHDSVDYQATEVIDAATRGFTYRNGTFNHNGAADPEEVLRDTVQDELQLIYNTVLDDDGEVAAGMAKASWDAINSELDVEQEDGTAVVSFGAEEDERPPAYEAS